MGSSLVFSGIAPHPPIMVPEVGREATADVAGSIEGMGELTRRIIASGAESVILISPHAPLAADAFVAYSDSTLEGDFSNFRAPQTSISVALDRPLLDAITKKAAEADFQVLDIQHKKLDHGTAVPLYFLLHHGWKGQAVALGYSFLSNTDHLAFGSCIRKAIDELGRQVAFVASGDLSHRLNPNAPAGFSPNAHLFDEQIVESLRHNDPEKITDIDQDLRKVAGECGYRSMLVALGATQGLPRNCAVINYEAPFGVGYLVAQITNARTAGTFDLAVSHSFPAEASATADLTALARSAVETFVRKGIQIKAPTQCSTLLEARAACFVCLKTLQGDLRGCIGSIEPARDTLAEEVIANAISAATRDPRFLPVSIDELPNLHYSIDILAAIEPATFADLDPELYGVIVEDETAARRGLLLPAIEGINTARQQVEIAARKAGIPAGTPLKLSRFRVQRFREEVRMAP